MSNTTQLSAGVESKIIDWCKKKYSAHADGYSVRVTLKGKYAVSYWNDYPMQHGFGKEIVLTDEQLQEALNPNAHIK